MKSFLKTGIVLILISFTIGVSAQEIKVTEFRSVPTDISARENTVSDANGDACALIKTRTGLQNLKFTCDLGILKTEYHEGEYWLWVSPNTSKINIEAEGIGDLQYDLPEYAEEYNVYVIFLSAILPDKVIFKNINSVKIETNPKNTEVYINKTFMGYSPINVNIPYDTILYEIRKKRYSSASGTFVYSENQNKLFISLEKNPDENRMYLIAYASGGSSYVPLFFGLGTGMLGKTGWYISFFPPIMFKRAIATAEWNSGSQTFVIDPDRFSAVTGLNSADYYTNFQENSNPIYNNFRLKAGITQRVYKNTYLRAGFGFAAATEWYKLKVIPYKNDPQSEIPINKTFYGKTKYTDAINGFVFETGIIFRVSNAYLVDLNISSNGFSVFFTGKPIDLFFPIEASLGIGYNF